MGNTTMSESSVGVHTDAFKKLKRFMQLKVKTSVPYFLDAFKKFFYGTILVLRKVTQACPIHGNNKLRRQLIQNF